MEWNQTNDLKWEREKYKINGGRNATEFIRIEVDFEVERRSNFEFYRNNQIKIK